MTPKVPSPSGGNTTTVGNETGTGRSVDQNLDNSSEEEEARPAHTAEIGTLKKLSVPGGTAWLGSSSGVYFVNTVRRAFSAAFAEAGTNANGEASLPSSEDILTGEDAAGQTYNGPVHEGPNTTDQDFQRMLSSALGKPPSDQKLAMELVTTFFRSWHPLFPFLHGPRFLADMDLLYAPPELSIPATNSPFSNPRGPANPTSATSMPSHFISHPSYPQIDLRKLMTFQLVINIASLDRTDIHLPESSRIKSTADVTRMAGGLALNHDIETIQVLLAAELYLVATIALRQASTIAGIVLRMIYHSGLHRCPLRYASLTVHDCEIRKRIFWSAYALDRHLSVALGDPNTFQDSDIDVCLSSSKELHRAVARDLIPPDQRGEEYRMHLPREIQQQQKRQNTQPNSHSNTPVANPSTTSTLHHQTSSSNQPQISPKNTVPSPSTHHRSKPSDTTGPDSPGFLPGEYNPSKQLREAALTAYVHYGKMTGRIIEIFHKSINFRFPKQDAIGYLTADVENWWNDLPGTLTGEDGNNSVGAATNDSRRAGTRKSTMRQSAATNTEGVDAGLIEQHRQLTPFFMLLYQQLLLLLNRPRLSLDQSTAEFQQGLQVCIRASRHTLSSLKQHKEMGQSMFLPGLLSATWMAGLIIAFACQLGKYPKARACADIRTCLGILEGMNIRWYTVKNCHKVLTLLLSNITQRRATATGYLSASRADVPQGYWNTSAGVNTRKRNRDSMSLDDANVEASPKRESISGESPISTSTMDYRAHQFSSPTQGNLTALGTFSRTKTMPQSDPYVKSSVSFDLPSWNAATSNSGMGYSPSNFNATAAVTGPDGAGIDSAQSAGAAIYADPQDMMFAQSSHSMGLPELTNQNNASGLGPGGVDDQMFWGNLDSNLFDVFGAVSWESMTGPIGPMVSNPNTFGIDMNFGTATDLNNGSGNGVGGGSTAPRSKAKKHES